MAYAGLHDAIMALPHSGAKGFEGLVADLLSEILGLAFSTQKSGSQSGTDALASTFTIGVEGKQYKDSTALGVDGLKAKLVDAASTNPDLELWILATTRTVDPRDAKALRDLAETFGLSSLILAWDVGTARIPPLALLCALAPIAVASHLGSDPRVRADLIAIASHPGFPAESQTLVVELKAADLGYSVTRAALIEWNFAQMEDSKCARLAFDSEAALLEQGNHRIGRPRISSEIEQWWSDDTRVAVVLGDEGMGKTWAALGWWADRAHQQDTPLCVIIPARDVDTERGPSLVAKALFKATNLRNLAFWEKRLHRWTASASAGPRLIVMIDGLNQKWALTRWSEVILSLTAGAWDGRARILFTCRPDHWKGKLRELADLKERPQPIDVGPFDNDELRNLLSSYKLTEDWDPAIKDLIRVPRLCHVAVRRHDDLADTGDITVERLIYEDWRHRSPSAQAAWSEEEFHDFIVRLATALRAGADDGTQSRAELIERVTQSSGAEATDAPPILSEIIDGGWMEHAGKPHQLRVRRERVPPVLGIALLSDLQTSSDQEGAEAIIAASLEPYQGNDISVAILRYAATFSLMDAAAADHVRIAMVKRWLGSQNFRNQDFNALWPLIGANPAPMLDCVEQIWFGANPSGREDEVIVKSFANSVKWPIVAEALELRLTDWLSRYWLDPRVGAVLGKVPEDAAAEARRSRTAARFTEWVATNGPEATGITPQRAEDSSWGRARATELLSWLPRARFVRPIKAWAVTTAILGPPTPLHRMEWVLRWNEQDPDEAEDAVLRTAGELLDHPHEVSRAAAAELLRALASPKAMQLLAEHISPAAPARRPAIDAVEVQGNIIAWDFEAASRWPRSEDNPLDAAMGLVRLAPDPELRLGEAEVRALRTLADRAIKERSHILDQENPLPDSERLPLARWAPDKLAELVRHQFRFPVPLGPPAAVPVANAPRLNLVRRLWARFRANAPLDDQERAAVPGSYEANPAALHLVRGLPDAALVLGEAELRPWRGFAAEQRAHYLLNREPAVELHSVSLMGLSASQQVGILLEWPLGPPHSEPWARQLEPLREQDFQRIAQKLDPAAPAEQIRNWLSLLSEVDLKHMPKGWSAIVPLLTHAAPRVRPLAMAVAFHAEDQALADIHEATGWACVPPERENAGEENAYGSLLLAMSRRAGTDITIGARVHGEVLGRLASAYPGQTAYLDMFAAYVEAELDHLFTAKSRTYPRGLLTKVIGWDLLASRMPTRVRNALVPAMDEPDSVPPLFMTERFPLYDAIDALATFDPGAASRIVTAQLTRQLEHKMRSGDTFEAAMRLPASHGDEARDRLLEDANDDLTLQAVVNGAVRRKRLPWLMSRISKDIVSGRTASIARGMVLAGFLPDDPEARALWDGRLNNPPAPGWLTHVHSMARRRFGAQRHAQRWYDAFAQAGDPAAAYAAHQLFTASADSRVYSSETLRPTAETLASWSPRKRAHWHWRWEAVKENIKRDEEKLKQTFLFSKLPGHAQHPRLQ